MNILLQNKSLKTKGFTLIELLVVIAIIAILSITLISSIGINTKKRELDEVANDIISLLRKARQNSVAILEHPEKPGTYPSYGVHFDLTDDDTILLYADCKADDDNSGALSYDNGDVYHYKNSNCGGKAIIEKMNLKHNITITALDFTSIESSDPTSLTDFNVLFIRPEPTIWFSGKDIGAMKNFDSGTGSITIANSDGTQTQTIHVNVVGLITKD